jgi:hypothetical protein
MGYVTKTNPVGVDSVINQIVESMYENLINYGWTNYEAYHRAYKNPKRDGEKYVPEVYSKQSVQTNEYTEVLLDDDKFSTSFFITGNNTNNSNGNYTVPISVIFQVNSQQLYPDLEYRADEECRNDAIVALKDGVYGNKITSVITDIPRVYEEFDILGMTFNDMQPFHVFRVNMDVPVNYDCNYRCKYGEPGGFDYELDAGMN